MALLSGQLRNVSQAVAAIQKMEAELRRELSKLAGDQLIELAAAGGKAPIRQTLILCFLSPD
jgi:hypothetical protein